MTSCASFSGHDHNKDRIIQLEASGNAKACLSGDDVKLGSKVKVYDYSCKQVQVALIKVPRYETKCIKEFSSDAEVVESLGNHHYILKPVTENKFKGGQILN